MNNNNERNNLILKIGSKIDTYTFEILEDKIRDLLEKEGIIATIEDNATGNTVTTRKEEFCKAKTSSDMTIKGSLTIGEKIWFNDDLRCRLRICGWNKEQIERLRDAKFIDLTILNPKGDKKTTEVMIHISKFSDQ